jgi:hypothetical protein
VDLYVSAQIAKQQAVKEFAVAVCLKTSDCKKNMRQQQRQARRYNGRTVESEYKKYGNKIQHDPARPKYCGELDCSYKGQNIWGPTRIIAECLGNHDFKITDMANFRVTRAVQRDTCHGKGTAQCVQAGAGSTHNKCLCVRHVRPILSLVRVISSFGLL